MATMNSDEAARILGVPVDISLAELNKRWRQIAKKSHPDLHPGDKTAELNYRKLTAAYDTLSKIREGARRMKGLTEDILDNEFDRWVSTLSPEQQRRIRRELDELEKEDDADRKS